MYQQLCIGIGKILACALSVLMLAQGAHARAATLLSPAPAALSCPTASNEVVSGNREATASRVNHCFGSQGLRFKILPSDQ